MNNENNSIRLKVLRYNPAADKTPHYATYSVPFAGDRMNLLQALEAIYQNEDDTLAFRRYSCGIQFCNSCLMLIDGKPLHACLTIVSPGKEYEVAPLPGKKVLCDLIVEME